MTIFSKKLPETKSSKGAVTKRKKVAAKPNWFAKISADKTLTPEQRKKELAKHYGEDVDKPHNNVPRSR
jgi:hypothetical protein